MRIAYDHQIFSEQAYGGVSRYFFEIARRIRGYDGYEVAILAPLHINNYVVTDPALTIWGRHLRQLPRPRRLTQFFNSKAVSWKLHREPVDVVHETYHLEGRLAPRQSKIVVTVHDMIHERLPNFFPVNDNSARCKKAAVKRADHIICISENTRTDLIDILGVERERTSVILQAYTPLPQHGATLGPPIADPYVAYVGERGGYKNFAGLVRAFGASELLRKSFSIVCFGGGPLSAEEREMIRRSGLHDGQVIQTKGDDAQLAALYRGAAAFVYPSLYEGFGLPPLEAMSARCPVVTSNTSSLPEVCGDAAEYFDPSRPESIAAAIERAVAYCGRRQELIELGLRQIEKFSWNFCARQTAAVYDRVTNRTVSQKQ